MNKTYIKPVVTFTLLRPTKMMALSYRETAATQNGSGSYENEVKGTNHATYNIWNDDWNK